MAGIELIDIHKTYRVDNREIPVLNGINLSLPTGRITVILGQSGCGKTTLLRLIAGDIEMSNLDSDESCGITMSGKQNIGFLRQINFTDGDVPVKEELEKAFSEVFACEARKKEIEKLLAETEDHKKLLAEYDFLERRIESLHGYSWKKDMETMFQKFGFALEDLEKPIGEFSGGQQTKIALIQLLLQRPDILLLDEPTNHLDIAAVEWLENYLKSYENAVVIVSHDRMFLDRVIDVTYEIEYGDIKRYPGNYSAFVRLKEEAQIKQEKDYEAQQKEIERLTAWIEKWKNTPTKVAATRSKRMAIEHMVKIEKPRRFDTKTFHALFHPARESYTDVLTMKKLKIGYDTVLSEVSAVIKKAERIAIIGENGKGKSTLLKTVVGEINPLGGSYQFGNRVDFAYFDQHKAVNQKFDPEQTVLDYFWSLYPNLLRNDVRSALGAFLFSGEDVEKKMGQLSGGEKVRLELCRIFYTKPNFLILDEPTNHLDMNSIAWLETYLLNYKGAVLIVSHDRYFLDRIAGKVIEIDQSKATTFMGNYSDYAVKKEQLRVAAWNAYMNQQRDIKHQEEVIEKLKSFNREKSIKRAESREKMLDKIEVIEKPSEVRTDMKLTLTPRILSGNDVLTVEHLSKSFDSHKLFTDVNFEIKRGEHVAIIGDNGSGKTTLLKILNGLIPADQGTFRLGSNVEIGYYDQEHHVLHSEKTLFEEISDDYPYLNNTQIRNVLAAFLFTGEDVFKRISDLSGGERGRVSLAKLVLSNANFLILDEPTNHLDIMSKEILEDALNGYEGTILYVSHDRYFINRTAHRILDLTEGQFVSYVGNYDYYLEKHDTVMAAIEANAPQNADADNTIAAKAAESEVKLDWKAQKEEQARLRKKENDLKKCEEKIAELEARISEIDTEMSDPAIGTQVAKLQELTKEQAACQEQLEKLYEQWEELAE